LTDSVSASLRCFAPPAGRPAGGAKQRRLPRRSPQGEGGQTSPLKSPTLPPPARKIWSTQRTLLSCATSTYFKASNAQRAPTSAKPRICASASQPTTQANPLTPHPTSPGGSRPILRSPINQPQLPSSVTWSPHQVAHLQKGTFKLRRTSAQLPPLSVFPDPIQFLRTALNRVAYCLAGQNPATEFRW